MRSVSITNLKNQDRFKGHKIIRFSRPGLVGDWTCAFLAGRSVSMAPIPPLVKNHLGPIYLETFHEHSNPRDVHPSSGTQTLKIIIITTVFIFCENDVVVTSWGAPANWTPWTWRLRRQNPAEYDSPGVPEGTPRYDFRGVPRRCGG